MPALNVSSICVWITVSSELNVLHSQPSSWALLWTTKNFPELFFFLLLPPHSSTEVAALPRLSPTASYPSLIFHFYLNIDFILPVAAPTVFPQLEEQQKGHPLNPGQDYSGWVHTLPALLSTQTNKTTSPGIDQHIMHGHCKCIRVISNSG